MKKSIKILSTICLSVILYSCATSMTPMQVNNSLPKYTKSSYLSIDQVQSPNCKCLTRGRSYAAPVGTTTKNDLQNAAKGIDEWVSIDGGNAYRLINFKWKSISTNEYSSSYATQLTVDFDTYICQ